MKRTMTRIGKRKTTPSTGTQTTTTSTMRVVTWMGRADATDAGTVRSDDENDVITTTVARMMTDSTRNLFSSGDVELSHETL